MPRFPSYLVLATLAQACVPSEDQSTSAPAQTNPTPAPPPPPTEPRAAATGGRLDPARPVPSANPFVLGEAGVAASGSAAGPAGRPVARKVSVGDQRRLVSPGFREGPNAELRPPGFVPGAVKAQPVLADEPPPVPPAASVAAAAVAAPAAAAAAAAKAPAAAPESAIAGVYYDAFDRPELGAEWNATSPEWRIVGGRLCGQRARNHPVWLKRKLPVNARIEFDAVSSSADGDLKVEIWGDGKGFAKGVSYTDATSYLAIFGGWKNQFHVLARQDEHAAGRPEVKVTPGGDYKARPVVANTVYHFKIERSDGKTVRWFMDDIEIISFTDGNPLKGEGHEHLGFNDWEVQVCFDNLQISALSGG